MKECDNSKIHTSSNFILSTSLLIMFDTLLLRPSLHCNTPLLVTTLIDMLCVENCIKAVRKANSNLVMKPFSPTQFVALRNVFLLFCERNNCDIWGCRYKGRDTVTFLKGLSGYFSV